MADDFDTEATKEERNGLAIVGTVVRALLWLAPFVAAVAFVRAWDAMGLVTALEGTTDVFTVCMALLGIITALRHTVLARDASELGPIARGIVNVALIAIATGFARFAIELPWNKRFLEIEPLHMWLEIALVALALLALYFLCGRRGALPAVGVAAFGFAGIAQYFVALFKGAAILPMDVIAVETAAAVGGSYRYVLDGTAILGIGLAMAGICACSLIVGPRHAEKGRLPLRVLGNAVTAIAVLAVLGGLCLVPSWRDDFGVDMAYWNTLLHYEDYGLLPSFIASVHDLDIQEPTGYTQEGARELEQELAERYERTRGRSEQRRAAVEQFEELQPTVIVIMDESFADLSQLGGERWGYEGPEFVCGRLLESPGLIAYGNLGISVLGGGTCNSEFEFLAGTSMGLVGGGKYPYQFFDLSQVPSLPRQFAEMGYPVIGMHPNKPNNWNRAHAFEQLGFEQFISEDAFAGRVWCHAGVSDAANFDVILEMLEEYQSPQFLFNVTMQNHSPYTLNLFPEEILPTYAPIGLDVDTRAQLNEYLCCIEESDRAIEQFLLALEEMDRPVVVVYFGDHHPGFSTTLNDIFYPSEGRDSVEHVERIHQTPYFVWANYEVAGMPEHGTGLDYPGLEAQDASADMLAAITLELIGAPLTPYQEAQLMLRDHVLELNAAGWMDAQGTWHTLSETSPELVQLLQIEYLEFAERI